MAASLPAGVRVFDTPDALSAALGAYVADAASAAVAARGAFVIALSGGSLPKLLAAALETAAGSGAALHTEAWHVFYADERVVPVDDADSNHAACAAALYSRPWFHAPPSQLHPVRPELSPAQCAEEYAAQVAGVLGDEVVGGGGGLRGSSSSAALPRFDCVLLGMGPDGHTASLFPGHPLLHVTDRVVAHITDSPKPPPVRVTLTLPVINHAERVAFVATGEGKAVVLRHIFDARVPLADSLPSARVRQCDTQPATWFLDAPAAALLH